MGRLAEHKKEQMKKSWRRPPDGGRRAGRLRYIGGDTPGPPNTGCHEHQIAEESGHNCRNVRRAVKGTRPAVVRGGAPGALRPLAHAGASCRRPRPASAARHRHSSCQPLPWGVYRSRYAAPNFNDLSLPKLTGAASWRRAGQACPMSPDSREISTPSLAMERCHLSCWTSSNMRDSSAGAFSHAFSWISQSSCSAPQPA